MSITICDTHLVRTVRYLSLTFEPVYLHLFLYIKKLIETKNQIPTLSFL